MRQAQWTSDGIRIVDVEPTSLNPGWVRLKVSACGICGSDLHTYRDQSRAVLEGTPGHEIVGTVVESPQPLPDCLYAVEPWVVCGACDMCVGGQRHLCRERGMLGGAQPGGIAEFVDVPVYALHPVPANVSPLIASIAEPFAVCLRGIDRAQLSVDSCTLVLGGGTIGLISGMLARDRASDVGISVRYPHQKKAAQDLGLTPVDEKEVTSWARDHKPDAVIETIGGTGDSLETAIEVCRPSGRIVIIGVFTEAPTIDALRVVVQELELIGSFIYSDGQKGSEFGAAVSLLPRYRNELSRMQTHQFPLTSISEAFACAHNKRSEAIKVTIEP